MVKCQTVKTRIKLRRRRPSIWTHRKIYFLKLCKILSMSLLIFAHNVFFSSVLFVNAQTSTSTTTTSMTTSETPSVVSIPADEYTKLSQKRPNFWTVTCTGYGKVNINMNGGCCVEGGCPCPDNPKICLQCGIKGECDSFCNVTISYGQIKSKSGFSWAVVEPGPLNKDCYYSFKGSVGQRIEIKIETVPGSEDLSKTEGKSLISGNGYVYRCKGDCSPVKKNGNDNERREKLMDIQNSHLSPPSAVFLSDTSSATLLIKNPGIPLLVTAAFIDGPSENFPIATTTTSKLTSRFPLASTLISLPWQPQSMGKSKSINSTTSRSRKKKEKVPKRSRKPTLEEMFSTFPMTSSITTTTPISIPSTTSENNNPIIKKTKKQTKTTTMKTPRRLSSPSPTQLPPIPIDKKLLLKNPIHTTCGSIFDARQTFGYPFQLLLTNFSATVSQGLKNEDQVEDPAQDEILTPKTHNCSLTFEFPSPSQAVQLTLFNYQLRGTNCTTTIAINATEKGELHFDSTLTSRRLDVICESTPIKIRRYTIGSNGVKLSLVILFSEDDEPLKTTEFLEGVFRFHDEVKDGTLKRDTLCDVVHDPLKLRSGHTLIPNPSDSFFHPQKFLFPMDCFHYFMPNKNNFRLEHVLLMIQSTYIKDVNTSLDNGVESLMKRYPKCYTVCRDQGCLCQVTGSNTLENVDHLVLFSQRKELLEIGCFCGPFGKNIPIVYESDAPLILKHHRVSLFIGSDSDSALDVNEMRFAIKFSFSLHGNGYCSKFVLEPPGRTKQGIDLIKGVEYPGSHFHYQNFFCSWFFKNSAIGELKIQVLFLGNPQKEHDCKEWSFQIFGTFIDFHKHNERKELFSLCPFPLANNKNGTETGNVNVYETKRNSFRIPGNVSHGLIQVNGTTKEIPDFTLRWSYNERKADGANFLHFHHLIFLVPFILLFFNVHFMNLY